MVGHSLRVCLWGLLIALVPGSVCFSATSPRYAFYDEAQVLEVVGPNLLKLKLVKKDKVVVVRLLGVGSPRNKDRVRTLGSEILAFIQTNRMWETSKSFVRSRVSNKVVQLWVRRWDQYDDKNRLLAYVMIPTDSDESEDLNGEIIRKGLGFVTRDYVHVTFVQYRQLEEEARKDRRGLWRGLAVGKITSLSH